MNRTVATIGSVGLAGFLLAGCATSVHSRAQEGDSLKRQVASLEGQVGSLSQRVDEVSQQQATLQAKLQNRQGGISDSTRTKTAATLSNRDIQVALKSAGFYDGTIDGKLGPKTKLAVKAFQQSRGLTPDGKVGSRTAMALAKLIPSSSGSSEQ